MRNYRGNIIFTIAIVVGLLHHIIGPASSSTLGSSNPRPQRRRSVLPTGRRPTKERRRREEGINACTGSSITTGEYRVRNSHLCFTDNSTFGINSNGELVYTVNDELIWQAALSPTLPPPQTNDCIVFGRCENQMTLIRLAPFTGSLTGFDSNRAKIWDSAIDDGSYIIDDSDAVNFMTGGSGGDESSSLTSIAAAAAATTTKNTNCTLKITEFGVTITNEDTQQVIWRIVAPGVVVDSITTNAPTNMPITTSTTTTTTTTTPTTQPTIAPTQSIVLVTTIPPTPTTLTNTDSSILLSTLVPTATTTNIPSTISTISNIPTVTSGHVGGITFLDTNNDGQRDNADAAATFEPNVPNVPIYLYTCSAPPIDVGDVIASNFIDPGSSLVAVARTDAMGEYDFDNLFAGHYRIQVLLPSDYIISSIWSGGTGGVSNNTNDIDPTTNSTPCFELLASADDMSWDIGLVILNDTTPIMDDGDTPPTISPTATAVISSSPPVTIFGIVFDDSNNNGYFDIATNNEAGVANVQAALFTCHGSILLTTKTDDNGMYGFSDLSSGSYQVKFVPPEGYSFSSVWTGSNADVNNNADPATGSTVCQSYFPGDSENMLDVGMILNTTATTIEEEAGDGSLVTLQPLAGDGTPCSGIQCQVDGMCRNQAGLCGSGISFCNPFSVWDPTCTTSSISAGINSPSITPSISLVPSVCNTDGSVGMTVFNNQSVQAIYFAFTYAIESSNNNASSSSDFDDLVSKFEMELNTRLACVYFIDNCLSCNDDKSNDAIGSVRRRRMSLQQYRFMLTINNSSVAGISHLPTDEVNVMKVCANGSQTDCRVMDGQFTAYFPNDISLEVMEMEREQMLVVVQNEIERTDFEGMRVSYDNAPFPTISTIVETNESVNSDNGNGGLSIGVIIGIIVTCIILVAVIAVIIILHKKEQEQSAVVPESVQQSKQNGHDNKEYDSDFDGSSSSSSSSSSDSLSSEDEDYEISESSMQSSMPDESAVSTDTFPSNVAQTTPQETIDQSDHSEDDSESLNIELEHIQRLQQVAASDNARPPFYGEDGREYSDSAYMDDENMTYGRNYDVTQPNQNDDSYNDELMSISSSDPPGTSYRDLPPEDQDNFDSLFNHQVEEIPTLPLNNSNSIHSFQINHDDVGYESKSSSQGSRGSRGSRRSHRSNRSSRSRVQVQQADLRYDDGNEQMNDQHYDYQEYSDVNSLNEDQDAMPAPPYNDNYQQDSDDNYQHDTEYDDNNHQDTEYYDQHGDYPQSNSEYNSPDDDYYQQHGIDGGNNVNRNYMDDNIGYHNSEEYIGEVDMDRSAFQPRIGFCEESYQFMPTQAIPFPSPAEELDEVSNSGSTSTQQRSNKSPRLGSQNHKRHEQQQEVESISSIFQSLSQIQTRLASKGKPTLSEGNLHDELTIKSRNNRGDIYAQHKVQQQTDVISDGSEWVGVVEDASVDGSQVSNLSSRVGRGQRPQQGQWIEPVDEEDYINS